jgi:serine phosphatase RsbU (regulator of sigma subunit)
LNTYTLVPGDFKYGMVTSLTTSWNVVRPSTAAPSKDEMDTLQRERVDLHAQISDAVQIQRKLSGPRVLHCGDFQFAREVFAARYLSGDFATFSQDGLSTGQRRVLAVLGDIAGKGVAAGMWFTHLAGLLQSCGRPDFNPATIASEINRHLCYLQPVAPFVTALIAQMDCDRGVLTYCNAGHFPPILFRHDGDVQLLEAGGPLLGALKGAEFQSQELMLGPGDTLVVYSDGVVECRNPEGEEFGLDRLIAALPRAKQQSAQGTLMMLLAVVQEFANGYPMSDDMSLTLIQRDTHLEWE